jgi:hypothetical protein
MRRRRLKVWFFLKDHLVQGPYESCALPTEPGVGLWREGLSQWEKNLCTPFDSLEKMLQQNIFYTQQHGFNHGPQSLDDLVQLLSSSAKIFDIQIWTPGLDHWSSILNFPEIMEAWGLAKRKERRAPLESCVIVHDHRGNICTAHSTTVSLNGLGLRDFSGHVGEEYFFVIQCPLFKEPLRLKARCVHSGSNLESTYGVNKASGFELTQVSYEQSHLISNYVQLFNRTENFSLE